MREIIQIYRSRRTFEIIWLLKFSYRDKTQTRFLRASRSSMHLKSRNSIRRASTRMFISAISGIGSPRITYCANGQYKQADTSGDQVGSRSKRIRLRSKILERNRKHACCKIADKPDDVLECNLWSIKFSYYQFVIYSARLPRVVKNIITATRHTSNATPTTR